MQTKARWQRRNGRVVAKEKRQSGGKGGGNVESNLPSRMCRSRRKMMVIDGGYGKVEEKDAFMMEGGEL